MAQEYVVQSVEKDETWSGNRGQMRTVEFRLLGIPTVVKVSGATKFPAPFNANKWPEAGDRVFGTVEGEKFRFEQRQNGDRATPQAASQPQAAQAASDPQRASIERQVAAKCAAECLAPHYPNIPDEHLASEVRRVVNAFAAAIQGDESVPF